MIKDICGAFFNVILNMINPDNFPFIKDKLINKIGKNKDYFYNHLLSISS